ncbi:hypothetical protein HID58_080898 [Brassica napus]|uniref:Uncharacterized protein n=1 Tax=Brassica napus TaxID=3708 RepID=A0ABQ7Y668_BRANA|nr:hypothetical protein HID58_080898 [Brassica napus]
MIVHPNSSKACVPLVYDSADIFTICAPKKDKVPPPSSKTAKSGGGKQKKIVASELTKRKTLKDLITLLQDKKIERAECEKLSLASLILVEGIILSRYTAKIIATSSLQEALNFEDYIRKP